MESQPSEPPPLKESHVVYCQKCLNPIVIDKDSFDEALKSLAPSLKEIVNEELHSYIDEIVGDCNLESFCYLCSSISNCDYPLCPNCCFEEITNYQKESEELEKEIKQYEELNENLEKLSTPNDTSSKSVEEITKESEEISHEIGVIREQREDNNSDNNKKKSKLIRLKHLKQCCIEEANAVEEIESLYRSEIESIKQKKNCKNTNLERLKRTNVLNDACFIWFENRYGVISGFRLGNLSSDPVDNHEINSALGQVTLLLTILAQNMNYTFKKYQLYPRGSVSSISVINDKTQYPLYVEKSFFRYNKFNTAIVYLLNALLEYSTEIMVQDNSLSLPFVIKGNTISDIIIDYGNQELWTSAMKCMLIDLKWAVSWYVKQLKNK